MPISLLLTLALTGCGKSDFGIYEASEAACDGLLGPDENEIVDSPWDVDGDGYFDARNPDCAATYDAGDLDCDDGNPEVNPGGVEYCDYADNDCDDDIDEDGAADALVWYEDADSDNHGELTSVTEACEAPFGYTDDATDCDDGDDRIFPGAAEQCDGLDNDCDVAVDEDASDAAVWYDDRDGDGYGDDLDPGVESCEAPKGKVDNRRDCDDDEPTMHPTYEEVCDGLDNDCDGAVEEDAIGNAIWYADFDFDGFGNPDNAIESCEQPANYLSDSRDCDDTRSDINPDEDEICDGEDNDCDAVIDDDAVDAEVWYHDGDGDDFGDPGDSVSACEAPSDYIEMSGPGLEDCDDSDDDINPLADERCDEVDEDCDGDVDEDALDAERWYLDDDGDSYGDDDDAGVDACEAPTDHVDERGDCDDSADDINPDADEVCDDEVDNDCDGDADEECTVDYSGLYGLDDTIGYQCAEFLGYYYVTIDFNQVTVSHASSTLVVTVGGSGQPGSMSGTVDSDGNFSVVHEYPGSCTETYTLEGSFSDESNFSGTFTAAYTGGASACLDCSTQIWTVSGAE